MEVKKILIIYICKLTPIQEAINNGFISELKEEKKDKNIHLI